MTSKMCLSDHLLGSQSLFNVFTQISPESGATLGWKILVNKKPFGALLGKPLSRTSLQRKTPPWYGVPTTRNKRIVK